jgi:hypothetical protein
MKARRIAPKLRRLTCIAALRRQCEEPLVAISPRAVGRPFFSASPELGKVLLTPGRDREVIPVLLPALQFDDSCTPVVLMFPGQA